MKDVKIRKSNGRFESRDKRNYKIGGIILLVGLALLGLGLAIIQAVGWGATHKIMTTAPVKVGFHKPIWVEERQPLVVISPMVEEVMEPEHELTTLEQMICDRWGMFECKLAIAVAKAESGLNCLAVNGNTNGSVDLGAFQINEVHYDDTFTPRDALDCQRNVDKAYEIWQEQGWNPWVAYNSGAFKASL